MTRYRLDEPISRGNTLKRTVWIEPMNECASGFQGNEKYFLIDLVQLLANKQVVILQR